MSERKKSDMFHGDEPKNRSTDKFQLILGGASTGSLTTSALTPTGGRQHVRIDNINRLSDCKRNDLVEDVAKLHLKFLARYITDVWRRNDLFKLQQRQSHVAHRLLFHNIDSDKPPATLFN